MRFILVRALEFVVFLLFLFLLYRKRERLEKGWRATSNWVVERKSMFSKPVSAGWLVSILFVLFVCSLSLYSRFLSAVLLALLVIASIDSFLFPVTDSVQDKVIILRKFVAKQADELDKEISRPELGRYRCRR